MIPDAVMDEVAEILGAIPGLVVLPFSATSADMVPAALITIPPSGTFDETYGRGMDTFKLEIFVLVSAVVDLAARNQASAFMAGSGQQSIKEALSSRARTWRSCDKVKVTAFQSARITMGSAGTQKVFLAVVFSADVYGRGA